MPSLHNSISVSIKVGGESLKTEERSTIRCLPWKPFHCQLGKECPCGWVCVCECECECESESESERERERESVRAHGRSESLTV